jgi:hypothetical protein
VKVRRLWISTRLKQGLEEHSSFCIAKSRARCETWRLLLPRPELREMQDEMGKDYVLSGRFHLQ